MRLSTGSWLTTIPLAAAGVALVVFVILPAQRTNASLEKEIAEKQQFVSAASQLAATGVATQQSLEEIDTFVRSFAGTSSAWHDRSALYARITEAAGSAGLTTTRFDPRPPQVGAVITRLPIHITGTGTFHQIAKYLYEVESLPMSIWVESVEIRRTAQSAQYVQLEASFVIFIVNSEKSD